MPLVSTRGVSGVVVWDTNMTAPRNAPAEQKVAREQRVTTDECEHELRERGGWIDSG
jgi:hypothetical protein